MKRFEAVIAELLATVKAKNSDYSGGSPDVLSNFRHAESFGVSTARGIMARMSDKWQRIVSLMQASLPSPTNERRRQMVTTESIRDTLLDLAAYALLGIVALDEQSERFKNELRGDPIIRGDEAMAKALDFATNRTLNALDVEWIACPACRKELMLSEVEENNCKCSCGQRIF